MSIIRILIIAILSFQIVSCGDGGGGVFVEQEQEKKEKEKPQENNKPEPTPDPTDPTPSIITSSELQTIINDSSDNANVVLDKEVVLDKPVVINKPITIGGESENNEVRIRIELDEDSPNGAILIQSDNVNIKNAVFDVNNIEKFIQTPTTTEGEPTVSDLTIENSIFFLSGKSRINLAVNNLTFIKSSIFGIEQNGLMLSNTPMVSLIGDSIAFGGNTVVDIFDTYLMPVFLLNVTNSVLVNNIIKGKSEGAQGLITMNSVDSVSVESNVISDVRSSRSYFADEDETVRVDGTIAISAAFSSDIKDNGNVNKYGTTHIFMEKNFPFDDEFANLPINNFQDALLEINFQPSVKISSLNNDSLYEVSSDFISKDESLINLNCEFPENSALSDISISYFNELILDEVRDVKIYYGGAIAPNCID